MLQWLPPLKTQNDPFDFKVVSTLVNFQMGKVGGTLKLKQKKSNDSKVQKYKIETETQLKSNPTTSVKLITKKTSAQLAFEAAQTKKQQEKLPGLAAKSHKEKVAEFNEYLGKLSEHHDIPKVGPG